MELQDRNLSTNMIGDDVALLQVELQKLGFRLQANEIKKRRFGRATGAAVRAFQKRHGLPVTGKVDERTLTLINREVEALDVRPFVVRGAIEPWPSGVPITVRAFDTRLDQEKLLGVARADQQGHYEIRYTLDSAIYPARGAVDVLIRLYDDSNIVRGESKIFLNAEILLQADVQLNAAQLSDYERTMTSVAAAVGRIPLTRVIADHLDFLAEKTGLDTAEISLAIDAAKAADRSGLLSPAAFYGLGRSGLTLDESDGWLDLDTDSLLKILNTAIIENIIPTRLHENLKEIGQRIDQLRFQYERKQLRVLNGTVTAKETNQPLENITIIALEDGKQFDEDITDDNGAFSINYVTEPGFQCSRSFVLNVINNGALIVELTVQEQPDQAIPFQKIVIPAPLAPEEQTLTTIAERLSLNLPRGFLTQLETKNVRTLTDLRRVGGLGAIDDLPPVNEAAIRLDSLGNLSAVSGDIEDNLQLIEAGFDNPLAIAQTYRPNFLKETRETLGDFRAAELHEESSAQALWSENVVAGLHLNVNAPPWLTDLPSDEDVELPVAELFPETCRCHECEGATSPTAYLADLIHYAVTRVVEGDAGDEVTLQRLQELLHQPLADLPASCDVVETEIRQVRICIEVLRGHFDTEGLPVPGSDIATAMDRAITRYLEETYTRILNRLGTSLDELREAKRGDEQRKRQILLRLQINPDQPDLLEELLLEPNEVTEAELERLFGFRDTNRPPLEAMPQSQFGEWLSAYLKTRWQEEDTRRGKPIIDPDLIDPGDLRDPIVGNDAFDLWNTRNIEVNDRFRNLKEARITAANDQAWLDFILDDQFDSTRAEILELDNRRTSGENIGGDLETLGLQADDLVYLGRVINTVETGDGILDTEADDVCHILVQASKRRQSTTWIEEENILGIVLGSDLFLIPKPTPEFPPQTRPSISHWRASDSTLIKWRNILQTRIDQEATALENLRSAVDDTEEETLLILRGALLTASGATINNLTQRLLIECEADTCLKTTRVAQAIQTIQSFLWSLRTRQVNGTELANLQLEDDQFEQVWRWIGSYEIWRAGMTVFLYPENALLPSLRPIKTPAFEQLISATRSRRGITPDDACALVAEYERLIDDVPNLEASATCVATTRLFTEKKCGNLHTEDRKLFFTFAHAKQSRTIYWSSYDPGDETAYAQSFWDRVPNVSNVSSVVGASVYRRSANERYIYLFYIEEDGDAGKFLKYIRYHLVQKSQRWDAEPIALKVGNGQNEPKDFEAVIRQGRSDRELPGVAVRIPVNEQLGVIWLGRLTPLGSSGIQEIARWVIIPLPHEQSYHRLLAVVGWKDDASLVLTQVGQSLKATLRTGEGTGGGSTSKPKHIGSDAGQVVGTVLWPQTNELAFVIYKSGSEIKYHAIWGGDCLGSTAGKHALGVSGFNSSDLKMIAPHYDEVPSDNDAPQPRCYQVDGEIGGLFRGLLNLREGIQSASNRSFANYSTGLPGITNSDAVLADSGRYLSYLSRLDRPDGASGPIDGFGQGGIFDPGDTIFPDPVDPGLECEPPTEPDRINLTLQRQTPLVPLISQPVDITNELTDDELRLRRETMEINFAGNTGGPSRSLTYLEEAYYYVPVHLALQLQRGGHFLAALDWYRTVYDYTQPPNQRRLYYGLITEASIDSVLERPERWLLDPLTPHAIAATRQNVLTKFTVISIARCLLAYADWEFSRDTSESVERARTLYRTALDLLGDPEDSTEDCDRLIIEMMDEFQGEIAVDFPEWTNVLRRAGENLRGVIEPPKVKSTIDALRAIWNSNGAVPERVSRIYNNINTVAKESPSPFTLSEVTSQRRERTYKANALIQRKATIVRSQDRINEIIRKDFRRAVSTIAGVSEDTLHSDSSIELPFLSGPIEIEANGADKVRSELSPGSRLATIRSYSLVSIFGVHQFCISPNPVPHALRQRAKINLYKILSCKNISGEVREILPYAVPLDGDSALQALGDGWQLTARRSRIITATPYRYGILIERAKQFAQLAQQMESAFLAALEKYDSESYSLMKARFDVRLSREGIRLHERKLIEAKLRGKLASLQHNNALSRLEYYENLRKSNLSGFESLNLGLSWLSSASVGPGGFLTQMSSFEKRQENRELQSMLARQQVEQGLWESITAGHHTRVVIQELNIAEISAHQADATAEFLANKFTNAELYEWMSANLEEVYRFFLQQATSLALVAEDQLAFERQAPSPSIVQRDYWTPVNPEFEPSESRIPDRRGLTGSAKLLQDIFQLDQYAFTTDQRKQQLTKTISLAQLFPIEFGQFRQTGVLHFPSSMELFDRDFPGHYLRLIKRVRVSIIALIPPTVGIKATLSCSGQSKAVVDDDGIFRTIEVRRPLELISLSSPRDASGMFDLQPNTQEMLLPFEGLGVDTNWEIEMPKPANPFDYRTISDVLFTIEYTALNSADYRRQVVRELNQSISADRPFSFRHEFADQWYELHNNPEQPVTPMVVSITTRREDFPPNIEELKIEHIVLFFSLADGDKFEVPVTSLSFKHEDPGSAIIEGGGATTVEGVVSTRRGNGGNWTDIVRDAPDPFGTWTLSLLDDLISVPDLTPAKAFKEEKIEDILFVITYSGQTSEWPA